MRFTIKQLYRNPFAQILARISRECTVQLSTGKELEITKPSGDDEGACVYAGDLQGVEQEEYVYVMMLMGI